MDNEQALKLLHRYHDATNAGTLDELDDLFVEDFTNFAAGFEPVKSLAAMKNLIRELLLAFPDWHVTVEDMFGQDNKVVVRQVSIRQMFAAEALIEKGLNADEIVVVRGQYRLSPGTPVVLADPEHPDAVPNPSTASSGMLP